MEKGQYVMEKAYAGGREFPLPIGIVRTSNITPDPERGIGNWTEEQFFRALREGKSKGLKESRPLLPPMPWFVYKNFSDTDIRAIFAFLKSTKPK